MEMDVIAHLFIILISLIILDQASHIAITNSIKVSDITGIGKTTVGFIVLAFSTSLPELSVAFIAALSVDSLTGESQAALSIGNVLGSNIVNICLIIGLAAIIVALRRKGTVNLISTVARAEFSSLYFGLFLASVIPLGLIYITGAGWVVGLILLLIFAVYTYQLSKIRIPTGGRVEVSEDREKLKRYLFFTLIGIFGVIISAYFLVESAVIIARFADVPRTLIGATIVAFGTSLPEFSLTVRACLKGQTELGLGNIIGSGFMNITLILGVSLFFPALTGLSSSIDMSVYQNLVVFSLIANLFMWYFLSIGRLSWKEGAIFLFIYLLFLASTLGFIQVRPQPV